MSSLSEKLWSSMATFPSELSAELRDRERFRDQLQAAFTSQPISFSAMDGILSGELERRSAVVHSRKATLKSLVDEQNGVCRELKQMLAQADARLQEARSKNSTLLQALEKAAPKAQLTLLKDNQQLTLQLQQTEEKVKALCAQNEQLEDARLKADDRTSNHKQATQLLQTELQDSRAQVEERENTIQTLRSKLRESEKNASPSAVELEKLRAKLFKKEVELSSASDEHKEEIHRMTTLLNEKEDSLRKLKETLRKSQQQGEDSFLQGEDLHARLTNPKGLLIKSSILQEKTKLVEEVKQLQQKIAELESLVSSQQVEISKWKSRAFKLKVKSKAEADKPSPPCTPTKRGFPMTSDCSNFLSSPKKFLVTPKKVLDSPRKVLESPRKLLDSPKVSLLDSPKSRFFDVGGSSELLSRNCPKQFFDNSSLGTIPEVSDVPDPPEAETDAAVGANRKDEWYPQSPKQEDMCKTQ